MYLYRVYYICTCRTNQDFKDKVGDYLRFGAIKDVEEIQYDGSLVHLNLLLKGSYSELQRYVRMYFVIDQSSLSIA